MKPSKPLYIINLDVYPNRNLSIDFVEEAYFKHCFLRVNISGGLKLPMEPA
jgi:hypothetical protein